MNSGLAYPLEKHYPTSDDCIPNRKTGLTSETRSLFDRNSVSGFLLSALIPFNSLQTFLPLRSPS